MKKEKKNRQKKLKQRLRNTENTERSLIPYQGPSYDKFFNSPEWELSNNKFFNFNNVLKPPEWDPSSVNDWGTHLFMGPKNTGKTKLTKFNLLKNIFNYEMDMNFEEFFENSFLKIIFDGDFKKKPINKFIYNKNERELYYLYNSMTDIGIQENMIRNILEDVYNINTVLNSSEWNSSYMDFEDFFENSIFKIIFDGNFNKNLIDKFMNSINEIELYYLYNSLIDIDIQKNMIRNILKDVFNILKRKMRERKMNYKIHAVNHNILRINSGMCGQMYYV